MAKKIKATCYNCDTVGYIPEDYTGNIRCPNCKGLFKRTGDPLSKTRKELLKRLKDYEKVGFDKVEWITARDEHVCQECKNKEGKIYTIDEMRDVLLSDFCKTDHFEQNCRCLIVSHFEKPKHSQNSPIKVTFKIIKDQ